MFASKKIVSIAMTFSLWPSAGFAVKEHPADAVMKRAATKILEKSINVRMGYRGGYKFISTELPSDGTFYTGATEMMERTGVSVPGMLSRRLVKFNVEGVSDNLKGHVVCDVDFRRVETDSIWMYFYSCEYSNPQIKFDWEHTSYGQVAIKGSDSAKLTAEEKVVLSRK